MPETVDNEIFDEAGMLTYRMKLPLIHISGFGGASHSVGESGCPVFDEQNRMIGLIAFVKAGSVFVVPTCVLRNFVSRHLATAMRLAPDAPPPPLPSSAASLPGPSQQIMRGRGSTSMRGRGSGHHKRRGPPSGKGSGSHHMKKMRKNFDKNPILRGRPSLIEGNKI
ncbi:unnamed protein product [Cuscuta campestris]|uniref:Uncharacterized protein n=1 Tax=Cuscuta campestris TaxID=132261 RepID=A0A484NK25_9ASTE|nr:unnamed protein product [Cuscuta campestris]